LGLVQLCLGAIVVLTTSTLNRLMVVEAGAARDAARARWWRCITASRSPAPAGGFLSDTGGNRTRFIIGGMAALAGGAVLAALGVVVIPGPIWAGLALSVLAYALIGLGAGASGTSLLACWPPPPRRSGGAAAATITWLMMIFGIAATAGTVGWLMEPYSPRVF
jgi:BCD family chlorophyll transporter-like MFS transporter